MKAKLIFLLMLISCISCGTNNKPVSDAQKEKIKGEVKEVVNTIFKGAEEANADMIIGSYLDSPDFVFTYNGNSLSYKQCADMAKSAFGTLKNQKITVVDEKYAVLDNSTVMVTVNNKCLMNYKDGHSVLQDPWISQMLFKKIDNKWKVISGAESGIEQSVKNIETSKELNQVELMKQFTGTWQGEMGKDTIAIVDYALLGTAIEFNAKIVTKGKIISTEKGLWGYDEIIDKIINAGIWNYSPDITLYAIWFTSKNIGEGVPFKDISNPENAASKTKVEFKSPDTFIETELKNNKVVGAYTFKRVKK
ncbi:MAG TPA: hypothetical protein VIK14_07835 [Ignavibacteria bacterium]